MQTTRIDGDFVKLFPCGAPEKATKVATGTLSLRNSVGIRNFKSMEATAS